MSIPYAPYIADTIPGFLTTSIKIPFTMNPAVSWSEIYGFKLQIKDYNGTNVIATSEWVKDLQPESNELTFTTFEPSPGVTFPVVGQYYKFQLAYMKNENDINLTYSFASIGKCIGDTKFIPIIDGLSDEETNGNIGIYFGNFTNTPSDPIYSYKFTLFDNNNQVLETTGNKMAIKNEDYKFKLKYNLEENNNYYLEFSIITINEYYESSIRYNIVKENFEEELTCSFIGKPDNENGFIDLKITGLETFSYYSLERSNNNRDFEELIQFTTSTNTIYTSKDYSIEQGIPYYYSIRKVDENGVYQTNRKVFNPVFCDYEDIFLTDINGKQLKIQFDPKVSSFKDIIQESKTETIGSQYPFFFRNGDIKYKEIPISGLISYNMDNEFMTDEELGFPFTRVGAAAGHKKEARQTVFETETIGRSTQLTGINYAAERKFKLKVMEWLNDGIPKLFRSPAEGVYILRLTNVSLSPNDTLGRMLHSFSATGYEASEHDLELLKEKGYIHYSNDFTPTSKLGWFILGSSKLEEANN